MTDTIFNGFIQSVYTGGSAMELFDNLEIIGGADDISVESIFGGHQSDELSDQESEPDITKPDDSAQHPEVCQTIDEHDDETKCDSKVNKDEMPIVSSIDMTIKDDSFGEATEGGSSGETTEGGPSGEATESDSVDISFVEPFNLKLKQKNEDSMSTSEIAEIISRYDGNVTTPVDQPT